MSTPETLTLAACRSLDLEVLGSCGGCNSLRVWVGARPTKHDHALLSELFAAGKFICATCRKPLDALEVRMRGNMASPGEVLARYEASNVGEPFEVGQREEDGRTTLSVKLEK